MLEQLIERTFYSFSLNHALWPRFIALRGERLQ
uniref:Uncharacterized protein n=1 Tax=Anguilla anguilla TaxID=7936 RepID=A0A0E9STJ0_ANGAN